MKIEDEDNTEAPAKAKHAIMRIRWTAQDAFCATLFGPWDNLPCHDYLGQPRLLRDLDRAIVTFEARINHCDTGFRAWRELHKRAMEAGQAEVPGFPSLALVRDGKMAWQDDVWEQRYRYLIYQRHRMVLARLERSFMLSRAQQEQFFGDHAAPRRDTMKRHSRGPYSRPLGLRCDWWRPLNWLLARAARRWGMDEGEVVAHFWRQEGQTAVKTEECENVVEGKGKGERGVGKVKGKGSGPLEVLDINPLSGASVCVGGLGD